MPIWTLCSMMELLSGLPRPEDKVEAHCQPCAWSRPGYSRGLSPSALLPTPHASHNETLSGSSSCPFLFHFQSFSLCSLLSRETSHPSGIVSWIPKSKFLAAWPPPVIGFTLYCHCLVDASLSTIRTGTRCVWFTIFTRGSNTMQVLTEYWSNEIMTRLQEWKQHDDVVRTGTLIGLKRQLRRRLLHV